MATTVLLHEVVDALDIAADELSSYVNIVTGQVITVTHEDLRFAEEDPVPDLPDWQEKTVAEARQVLESKDWLELPSKFDIHEWKIMDGFGRSLSTAREREEVSDAIHGSGAFRNFKSTVRHLGIEAAWFAYRQGALEDIARNWLADHGLQVGAAQPAGADGRGPRAGEEPRR